MYFRTPSDLAPEIVRFNMRGLLDDQGSMHNILRPETALWLKIAKKAFWGIGFKKYKKMWSFLGVLKMGLWVLCSFSFFGG